MWFESEPDVFRARGRDVVVYLTDNNEIEEYASGIQICNSGEEGRKLLARGDENRNRYTV